MATDPTRYYEVKGQVCPLLCSVNSAIAVANNTQLIAGIAAVAGASAAKKIRVMGWIMQSGSATVPGIQLKSASGGTMLTVPLAISPNTAGVYTFLPIVDCGYFETNAGEGLFCDVTGAVMNASIFYITYTP